MEKAANQRKAVVSHIFRSSLIRWRVGYIAYYAIYVSYIARLRRCADDEASSNCVSYYS